MRTEHKAIMARAAKEGLLPSELAAELVVHDLVNATRAQMSRYEVGYNKMTEKQQDAVLGELQENFKGTAEIIGRILASAATPSVPATLKDLKISNGTLTCIVDGGEQYFNELISKVQDKSEVLLVLYERQYSDALDNIQSEKDQKSLPLDGDSPKAKRAAPKKAADAAKAIELPTKLVEDGRAFIVKQQTPNLAALQNFLKINTGKADALLKVYEQEGLIYFSGTNESGQYEMVRTPKVSAADEGAYIVQESTDHQTLTDDLYDAIKKNVIAAKIVSPGALAIAFDLTDEITEQAIDLLELEGVISAESEIGTRHLIE